MSGTPIKYNKLVRDKIPDIIKADGWHAETVVLTPHDHVRALEAKLIEECGEYLLAPSVSELVDILEVVRVLAELAHDTDMDNLLKLADKKREDRGSLYYGFLLKTISQKKADTSA